MMLIWKRELQHTVPLPGEQPSSVAHNCLLYKLPCCCHEAKHTYLVPSAFLQDLILIPGSLLAQRIRWFDPKVKAAFLVSIPLLSASGNSFFRVCWDRKRTCGTHNHLAWKTCSKPFCHRYLRVPFKISQGSD